MSRNYYYIVAGLPDIILDNTKKKFFRKDVIEEISEQVHPDDILLLKFLQLPFDNYNLLNLLEKKNEKFDNCGNFFEDTLETEIKEPDILPDYMKQFIEAYKEEKMPFPGLIHEDQLNRLFYDEVKVHKNLFIREWFSFELDLRNFLAGLNSRKLTGKGNEKAENFSLQKSVICRNEIAELILKSNAPDFSLSSKLPWIENLLSSDQNNLLEFEKKIDMLRWEILNDLTTFTYFQIETILAFCIKIGIVERWQKLKPETGKERLEQLLSELITGYSTGEDF